MGNSRQGMTAKIQGIARNSSQQNKTLRNAEQARAREKGQVTESSVWLWKSRRPQPDATRKVEVGGSFFLEVKVLY